MSLALRCLSRAALFYLPRVCSDRKLLILRHCCVRMIDFDPTNLSIFPGYRRLFSQNTSKEPCWRCGGTERKSEFFCGNCNALQKPQDTYNFFHLLGLKESFNLDPTDLSKRFRQLQTYLHPDKFSNASDVEKEFSDTLSSLVNKSFRTLSDPLERGLYLLSLKGSAIQEQNTSSNKTFLLEIMELNEELESITNLDELKKFHAENGKTLNSFEKEVSEAFVANDIDSAKSALMGMKYYRTIDEKIKEKMLLLEGL